MKEYLLDDRRLIALPGNAETTIDFCAENWLSAAKKALLDHGFFSVALSGGSTPKKIYQKLVKAKEAASIDWRRVYLFWSDERSVPPTSEENNYHMAMVEGRLNQLPIPRENIFRMIAEDKIEENALNYESIILEKLGSHPFDLIMLGLGEDGHTASLFPHTEALTVKNRLVVGNYVPQKKTWRMTFTADLINQASAIVFYVLGESKAETVKQVLDSPYDPLEYPAQLIGTKTHKALWIVDEGASKNILSRLV